MIMRNKVWIMYKRFISLFTIFAIIFSLVGCGNTNSISKKSFDKNAKLKIVTTIFPIYDIVKNIVGDDKESDIKMLVDSGIDMHSFNPTAEDLRLINECDIFIYVGGESDDWAKRAVRGDDNLSKKSVSLMVELPHICKEEDDDMSKHYGLKEYKLENDEHIWMSPSNVFEITNALKAKICSLNSDKEKIYEENTKKFIDAIVLLDDGYEDMRAHIKKDTIIVADRFPFKYLCVDYRIKYFSAFSGCSAESEASFEKITSLANNVDDYDLNYVFIIEGNNNKIANTVIENTKKKNAKILTLDSMQSVTAKDIKNGASYLSIMEKNLLALKEGLEYDDETSD